MHVHGGAAAARRAAALLSLDELLPGSHPRRRRARTRRCACAAAAARISTATRRAASCSTRARYRRHRRLRADRAGDHRALRHAARRARAGARASSGQCLPFEPPHFGAARPSAAASPPGLSGPRRASAGAVRDFVLGVKLVDGRGARARLRRPGDEERRRLRRLAPAGRLARHARPDRRGLAQGAAARRARRRRCASRCDEAARARALNRWAGQPLPISASAWQDGVLLGAAFRRRAGGRCGARRASAATSSPMPAPSGARCASTRMPSSPAHERLWRLPCPRPRRRSRCRARSCIEWGGGLRWLRPARRPTDVREAARARRRPCDAVSRGGQVARAPSRRSSRCCCGCIARSSAASIRPASSIPAGCIRISRLWRASSSGLDRRARLRGERVCG